ncbi:NTP transferase domain-containing protein [Curtobacterium pusillum]|uniref:nucleotidyltransferase family protein n=1 Tax=Curtobacterium pusillum TaxID=69373 RepID=UPI0021B6916B|nr:nucleotidyltransferase family protein [Curtobacterium pusillum]
MDESDGAGTGATVGLLLAAGAGRRMGRPKALLRDELGRPWTEIAVAALLDGGCDGVVVVLGAESSAALGLVPDRPGVHTVVAPDWERGLGASLATGLAEVAQKPGAVAALITLVDLPGMPADAVRRVLGHRGPRPEALAQAVYDGRPGHPVLIGRDHWSGLRDVLHGDRGAGAYLRQHGAERIDCADLWDGADQDTP